MAACWPRARRSPTRRSRLGWCCRIRYTAAPGARAAAARFGHCAVASLERWADQAHDEAAELVDEAVTTGRRFGLVGRYTALVGIEDWWRRQRGGIHWITRDDAGVALQEVDLSTLDEARAAADDDVSWGDPSPRTLGAAFDEGEAVSADVGVAAPDCSTAPLAGGSPIGLLLLVLLGSVRLRSVRAGRG